MGSPSQWAAEEFATLVHEVAHALLHQDEGRIETSKSVRETDAEAVAFVVCGPSQPPVFVHPHATR